MSKEIIAGRSALKRSFKEFFTKAIDDGRETRSFLPFRKQKDTPLPPPWIFLFHGEEGLGKTTALHYCIALADETASELKKSVKAVTIDWDDRFFTKGTIPGSKIEILDAIVEVFEDTDNSFSGNFSTYKKAVEQYKGAQLLLQDKLRQYQLDKVLGVSSESDAEDFTDPASVVKSLLPKQDLDIVESGEKKLLDLVVNGISSAAEEIPLILAIDSYSKLAPDLELWFRSEFLATLAGKKNRLTLIIGGSISILRNFRNEFPDEAIYAVNFSDIPLTRQNIVQIASKQHISLSEVDAGSIEKTTAGIPFLVHDILFYLAQNKPLSELIDNNENDVHAAEKLASSILNRFFTICAEPLIRERVFSLAMMAIFNPKALAEIWNVPFSDVKHALDNLETQTSFVKNQTMHAHIRKLLRMSLVQEAALTTQSPLKPFFSTFSTANTRIFKEMLSQLQTALPVAEKRCSDIRYLNAIEQMVCGMMWSSPTDAFIVLPGYFLELLHFNQSYYQKLLSKVAEFRSILSPVNDKIFKQLINGLTLSDKSIVFNRQPVKPIEDELIAYIESVSESMNNFQRALFYHLKAEIDIRKGNLKEAMENLNRCFSLLGNSSPEKTILYEDYVILGTAFNKAGEHRNAIETFSNAVLIRPDGFATWYLMGLSRMTLEEFEGAINAFSEAVKIDPAHTDAWYNLGLSLVKEEQHEDAVNAFIKATDASPERPEIWFVLGHSYIVLGQHTDAIKAFRKVVLLEPDNGEAWILLGNSCSALGSADDAIEAYKKAVDLKPKSIEPLKALGNEFFQLKRFDEAVEIFTKATKLAKKDILLWCLIAESYIGCEKFELAVDAGDKALAINDKDARTWSAIGNAQMALSKNDEAIEAFKKSVECDPENAGIWQKLGTIYTTIGNHDDAIASFKKAVAFDPSLKEVWYTIGKAYESQQCFAEAVSAYEKGVHADPVNIDCWFRKGEMHSTLEQPEDAFDSFTHVVSLDSTLVEGWFKRGESAGIINNFTESVNSFAKVVELDATHSDGWYNLGSAYQKLGDHQEAIRSFTEAATYHADWTDIWYQLGISCQTLGIYEEAVTAYEKCVDLEPSNQEFPSRLGSCFFALGNFEKAYSSFKKAATLDPENLDTLFHLALTAHSMENFSEAIVHYQSIIAKNTEHADAQFNCALAYHAVGQFDKAIDIYLGYIIKWPENSSAFFNLGLAYHAAEDLPNAIVTYREALKIQPENADVWYNLGIALHTKEQYGDAIQAYRKVLQLAPEHKDAWFNLGMAYYVWQNFNDAIDAYSKVVKLDPTHSTAWGNITIAHFANNDYTKGLDAARKAFAIVETEPWLIGNMVVGLLFTGESTPAQEFTDRLIAIDGTGEIMAQTVAYIEAGLKLHPETTGADIITAKLKGNHS